MGRVHLAFVEGMLEAPMARRLLKEVGVDSGGVHLIVAGGSGPFWERAPSFNEAARHHGFVLGLTDLDAHPCPSALILEKLGASVHSRFLLRIQVRELESWLLADSFAWAAFLKVSEASLPRDPDLLTDPKQALVNLVRRSNKKQIREDIVPRIGSHGVVGPGYSTQIGMFIADCWSPTRAAERSPSLMRALRALRKVAEAP